jgi:hypothetical protein
VLASARRRRVAAATFRDRLQRLVRRQRVQQLTPTTSRDLRVRGFPLSLPHDGVALIHQPPAQLVADAGEELPHLLVAAVRDGVAPVWSGPAFVEQLRITPTPDAGTTTNAAH